MALSSPSYQLSPRQLKILEQLERLPRVDVNDLAGILNVSEVTIRKDLQELETLSLLKRVHGGAVSAHRTKWNPSMENRLRSKAQAK